MAKVIIDVTISGIEYRIPDLEHMSPRLQEIRELLQEQAIFFQEKFAEEHIVYLVWNEDNGGTITRFCDEIPTEELDAIWENRSDQSLEEYDESL